MGVGIESINAYFGVAAVGVRELFGWRGLDLNRFDNLMMERKSVNLPCEDPVTNAVNAAKPIVDGLDPAERDRIELLIVGTESGLDFGKSISTYVHHHLGLSPRCRSFEVKHACYGGTAALQSAAGIVGSSAVPGVKALAIATDAPSRAATGTYWEPSEGAGAVAMLVSDRPEVLELDPGANGYHTFEVMDTLRPRVEVDAVNADLSLLSYLRCLEESYAAYGDRVPGVDIVETFDHLVFHTPFARMVKGAHRMLLRKLRRASPAEMEQDFADRVAPSLRYAIELGNTYSAALYVALCSLLDNGAVTAARRVGLFSYGSGCVSEFFSGVVGPASRRAVGERRLGEALAARYMLTLPEYDAILERADDRAFGVRDQTFDVEPYAKVYASHVEGRGLLVLDRIADYHREYRWS
ncbi:MAG TPA: hydroxymethylglutaryl-CoA synthase [Micromonosporaceae bacterium]|nr:hydroxymethylglutaryl-CoA synthase [Micromonosporaceae bacterium]